MVSGMRPAAQRTLAGGLKCILVVLCIHLVGCVSRQVPVGAPSDAEPSRQTSVARTTSDPVLRISFLNVGLGDAILITCPDREEFTLIDAGDSSAAYPQASAMLRAALRERMEGVKTFARTINTHPHPDHVAGFLPLFESGYRTLAHFDDGSDFAEADYEERLRELLGERYQGRPPERLLLCGSEGALLEQITLTASQREQLSCPQDLNACSLTFRLTYHDHPVLLLADATNSWEQVVLADGIQRGLLSAVLLKVGHHASHASTSSQLLDAVSPDVAVITAGSPGQGRVDELGYPRYETVQRLVRYFDQRFRDEQRITPIPACRMWGDRCRWEEVRRSSRVRATSVDGSIDVQISPDGVRVLDSLETW